jgi:dTDP-4-amino-4,6-dideoxygalactose transaminase
MENKITFNKPHITGFELGYIEEVIRSRKLSGNAYFTKKCQNYFEVKYGFKKCLLTTSCTDALEMAAILANIEPGDEVIMPSYTFVSTANAFVLRGAKIVFCDSKKKYPTIDENLIESLITSKTKAIVPVHYAGVSCDMEKIMSLSRKYNLFVIEDAAQAIDSYYIDSSENKIPLGSIGHFSTFSFHETKNIVCGEGGMLVINDTKYIKRAEVIWEKGTNRSAFFRGEVNKYGWIDIGSSYLPSELLAAFLWAQLEQLEKIQNRRIEIWNLYYAKLKNWASKSNLKLPFIPAFATNNAHMFYLICESLEQRTQIIEILKANNIQAVSHYLSLEESSFGKKYFTQTNFNSNNFTQTLLRLPLYYDLNDNDIQYITEKLMCFEK